MLENLLRSCFPLIRDVMRNRDRGLEGPLVSRVYLKPDFRGGDVSYTGGDGCPPFLATSALDSLVPRYVRGYDIIYSRDMEFIRRENCTLPATTRFMQIYSFSGGIRNYCKTVKEANKIHDYTSCKFLVFLLHRIIVANESSGAL